MPSLAIESTSAQLQKEIGFRFGDVWISVSIVISASKRYSATWPLRPKSMNISIEFRGKTGGQCPPCGVRVVARAGG